LGTKHHRLPRSHYQGRVWASFTLCIEQRKRLFVDARVVEAFVSLLKQIAEKHDFRAIYCFMPDHLHLISLGRSDHSDILLGVEEFKQLSGHWLADQIPTVRWQKGFFDRIIRARNLGIIVRYVLDNPVRARLVTHWRQYPFIGGIGLDLDTFLEELGPD
jgi:REP element-mobilizing transposase RayT